MQWEHFRTYHNGSAFVIYGSSVLRLTVVIYFICNAYGKRFWPYVVINFRLVAVHLRSSALKLILNYEL